YRTGTTHPHPPPVLLPRDPGQVRRRDRGDGEADRGAYRGTDSAADATDRVHRASFAARGQEVAGAVRDPRSQTAHRYREADAADGRRAAEARPARGRRH